MASSSGASTSTPGLGNGRSSRFSTLNVFKFNAKEKPPPPPPKDPYYLQNRSLASLSPDALSLPPQSPLSPHYQSQYPHRRSPAPSQSTMSLVSSAASAKSIPPSEQSAPKKKKSLSFLKFGRRTPKSASPRESDDPPPPEEDENISWPSNFQHNIHVDEAFVGLPPSWSTSLAQMGFSEEEIAQLNARRAVNPRAIQQLYNGRPDSPSAYNSGPVLTTSPTQLLSSERPISPPTTANRSASPILTNPTPRSTSLMRRYSNTSLQARSQPAPSNAPILSTSPSSASISSTRNPTTKNPVPPRHEPPSLHNPSTSILSLSSDSHQSSVFDYPAVASAAPGADPFPSTRGLFQPLANPQLSPISPPPAYSLPPEKTKPTAPSGQINEPPTSPHKPNASVDSTSSQVASGSSSSHSTPQQSGSQPKRMAALPPRLSLHASGGSDDWSKLVLSASLLDDGGKNQTSRAAKNQQSSQSAATNPSARPTPRITLPDTGSSSPATDTRTNATGTAAARSPPNANFSQDSSPLVSSTSPSWHEYSNELEGFVDRGDFKEAPLSAALTDFSPTLPESSGHMTPGQRDTLRPGPNGTLFPPTEDDELLGVRKTNRDSSRSSSSTLTTLSTGTVTGYSSPIIRNASIVRRTGAYVTQVAVASVGFKDKEGAGDKDGKNQAKEHQHQKLSPTENPPLSPMGVSFNVGSAADMPSASGGSKRQSAMPPSPMNSQFGSDESSVSGSTSSSSQSQDQPTPTTDLGNDMDLASYYTTTPSPSRLSFSGVGPYQQPLPSPRDTFGGPPKGVTVIKKAEDSFVDLGRDEEDEEEEEEDWRDREETWGDAGTLHADNEATVTVGDGSNSALSSVQRPMIVIHDAPPPSAESPLLTALSAPSTPLTPIERYPGWLSGVVAPLSAFIDEAIEPREHYIDLQEIAEGESGSIFAGRLNPAKAAKLRLPPIIKARDTAELAKGDPVLVAIKVITIAPPSSNLLPETQKLLDLERELTLMRGLWHESILGLDALYVDLNEDTLWVRMELMERSLADVVGLVAGGLMLQDRMIARFARDILLALEFLQTHRIAHRDVRSDNLLLNSHGVLKLTDFSNAIKLPEESSSRSDPAGVIFWQAPEMRYPNYDALKVDVWSVGATMWEMAETEPPFSDTKQVQSRWPPLTRPEMWSPMFHSFLRACSDSAAVRKSPTELLKDPFVSNACGRGVIVQLLSQCMNIERLIQGGGNS